MLFQRSLILIVIFYITLSMAHPTILERKNNKRPKRKSLLSKKNNKKKTESECLKDFCEKDSSYPTEEIRKLVKENSLQAFYMRPYEIVTARSSIQQEHLCQVITKTLQPKRASTGFGSKEYVVQTDGTRQTIHIEACTSEEPKIFDKLDCLPNGHNVICQQQYRLIPLWVYDEKEKNLKSTQFKVPSGCTVHLTKRNLF